MSRKIRRRGLIKTLGTAGVFGGIIGKVSAGTDTLEVSSKALKILRKKGKTALYNYLEQQEIKHTESSVATTVSMGSSTQNQGVSTEQLDCLEPDDDCSLDLKLHILLLTADDFLYQLIGWAEFRYKYARSDLNPLPVAF